MYKIQYFCSADKLADEELVTDMIYNFVLPEVEKHNMRKKIRDQQQSYMRNAYISLYEKILELPIEPSQVVDQEVPVQDENVQTCMTENMVKIDDLLVLCYLLYKNIHYFFQKQNTEAEEIELPIPKTDTENKKRADSKIDPKIDSQSDLMEAQ